MTTPKFTQEPWAYTQQTVYALDENSVNKFSALVQGGTADSEELQANVALMAASRELYEALCDAVKELEGLSRSLGYEFDKLPAYKAVLSKARGEG